MSDDAPTVLCVFDDEYDGWSELESLAQIWRDAGVATRDTAVLLHADLDADGGAKLRALVDESEGATVFAHCDSTSAADPDGVAVQRALFEALAPAGRFVGNDPQYCANCTRKSSMNTLFVAAKLATPALAVVRAEPADADAEAKLLEQIQALTSASDDLLAVFCKLDDGFDSERSGVLRGASAADLLAQARDVARETGRAAVVQPLLRGREWTVAVAGGRAHGPIESVFAENELFKPSGGTKGGEAVERDEALRARLQQLALAAFAAVGGNDTSYGRVDIRELDRGAGNLHVLEVNPMCSLTRNSYFELSIKANEWTMEQWLQQLVNKK